MDRDHNDGKVDDGIECSLMSTTPLKLNVSCLDSPNDLCVIKDQCLQYRK